MPRPRSVSRTDDTVISNGELARIFNEIGDMLEIQGEVVYKAVAYRRVADAVERYPDDVAALFRKGEPPKIPGAGSAINAKLAELAETGRLDYHDRLRAQVPDGLLDMLRVPGVGPKTVRLLHAELGIDSVEGLRAAAEAGQLRSVKGLSARTEQNVLEGIGRIERRYERMLIHDADAMVVEIIDLLAAVDDPGALITVLDGLPGVDRVLSAGIDKSSIVLADGLRIDLMVCPPAAWGTHLVHFTGNADHNIGLRGMALDRGWSLSEKGFKVLETGELIVDAEETDVYERLGLPWIPPEMREGDGEIAAALAGALPDVVTHADVRGDTHTHSNWTDGVDTIEVMARAARDLGHEYIVLTDHSPSLGVARGLVPQRVAEQKTEIDRVNRELAPFRVLHGTELEIRADATLDYPDELLAVFDLVIASIHTGRGQTSEQLTKRALAAIDNPFVDVIAHPTGRIVNRRDPMPLDWPRLFAAAARTGTLLEMNGSPRLDLDDALGRAAAQAGVRLTLASDAHRTEELSQIDYAVSMARRAWLTRDQVAGTRDADDLLEIVA